MRKFLLLMIAAVIIGLLCFGVLYGILKKNVTDSLNLALSAAVGGIIAEYIRMWLEKKRRLHNERVGAQSSRVEKSALADKKLN